MEIMNEIIGAADLSEHPAFERSPCPYHPIERTPIYRARISGHQVSIWASIMRQVWVVRHTVSGEAVVELEPDLPPDEILARIEAAL